MKDEIRDRLEDYEDEVVQDCIIIVANEDLCEIPDVKFQCTDFEEARKFINTVQQDHYTLRKLHLVLGMGMLDRPTTRMCYEGFDNYSDALELLSHMDWLLE